VKKNVENFYNIRDIEIEVNTETNDKRSYHVNSEKITRVLGFRPKFSIDDAVISLCQAFKNKLLVNTMDSIEYSNVEILKKNEII